MLGTYIAIGAYWESQVKIIKQRASPKFETWQKQVENVNALEEMRRAAQEGLGIDVRHGHHVDNAAKLQQQAMAVRNALRGTCFVLTERQLDEAGRTPMAVGTRIIDVRAAALNAIMPWLAVEVVKLQRGTDDSSLLDAQFGSQLVGEVDGDEQHDDAEHAEEEDDDADYVGPSSLVFTYV